MRPERHVNKAYVAAFTEIAERISDSLAGAARKALPIRMYVAGGAALHFYTGERISADIDASFSRRVALPDDLEVAYQDVDGRARLLYVDRNYSDTLALMHEDAWDDSRALELAGIDAAILDVRLLAPVDLAISKVARFSPQDRDDISALARRKLLDHKSFRKRADEALSAYVGDIARVRGAIEIATRIVAEAN